MYRILLLLLLPLFLRAQNRPTTAIESYFDLRLTDPERDSLLKGLEDNLEAYKKIHAQLLPNQAPMSLVFDPHPTGFVPDTRQETIDWGLPGEVHLPANRTELAFFPAWKLSVLIKNRQISSVELTRFFLDRIKRYGDTLQCSVELLEERAMAQARQADAEIAAGRYRGPLHGIPYGVKDLFAVKGTRTTWGAAPYQDQVIDQTATVVQRLDSAGAVLVVKLTLGALAMGDVWFGGVTKNPWDLTQGSSGSSAGSASAVAAGMLPFAIGTETLGSIVSPSTRCGVTGLRPTFSRVSKHGAMALCWSMDKIGPMTRSALDCALVLDVIRGEDGLDHGTRNAAFNYHSNKDVRALKVGYLKNLFDADYPNKENDQQVLRTLDSLGVQLVPVSLPDSIPVEALIIMLTAEAAASFDGLTRSDLDDQLIRQDRNAWPNLFRTARFIPAVEYINASRIRTQLIEAYHQITREFDVIVSPSFGRNQLLTTNLTGHPCLVLPNGFNSRGTPTSISFLGRLYGEADLITIGRAYQEATAWEDLHPEGFTSLYPAGGFDKTSDIVWASPEGFDLTMDIYTPRTGKDSYPVIVMFHGGGWLINNKSIMDEAAAYLAANGEYIVCNVNYRLLPDQGNTVMMNEIVEDAMGAVLWVRENIRKFKGDPGKIIVTGDSAGGHLAMMVVLQGHNLKSSGFKGRKIGFKPSYLPPGKTAEQVVNVKGAAVQAAVINYGAFDLLQAAQQDFESGSNFFWTMAQARPRGIFGDGITVQTHPDWYRQVSPAHLLFRTSADWFPPILFTVGEKDDLTTPASVKAFAEDIKQYGFKEVEYWEHKGRPHAFLDSGTNPFLGISFAKDAPPALDRMLQFLDSIFHQE